MEITATVLNVRFGTIEENNQPWAHLNIVGDEQISEETVYGVNTAKLKIDTDSNLPSRFISDLRKNGVSMPCSIKLKLAQRLQANELKMIVVGYELPK